MHRSQAPEDEAHNEEKATDNAVAEFGAGPGASQLQLHGAMVAVTETHKARFTVDY